MNMHLPIEPTKSPSPATSTNVLMQPKMLAGLVTVVAAQVGKGSPELGAWMQQNAADIISLVGILMGVNWKQAGVKLFSFTKKF